ncbi:hypothetical protein CCYA_CCYA01G0313 [Cyanidiococcus yangmingshanensis]|nr:hypothetical protein CCYA_CCYA01G0313 [Cyanidiococcus yangmingshanensis]
MISTANARESSSSLSPLTPGTKACSTERTLLSGDEWATSSDWDAWSTDCATYACLWRDDSTLCSLWSVDERDCQQVELFASTERTAPTFASPAQPNASRIGDLSSKERRLSRCGEKDTAESEASSPPDTLTGGSNLLALTEHTVHTAGGGVISVRFRDEKTPKARANSGLDHPREPAMQANKALSSQDTQSIRNSAFDATTASVAGRSGSAPGSAFASQFFGGIPVEALQADKTGPPDSALTSDAFSQSVSSSAAICEQNSGRSIYGRRVHAPLTLETVENDSESRLKIDWQGPVFVEKRSSNMQPSELSFDSRRLDDLSSLDIGIDEAERVISRSVVPPSMLEAESALQCGEWLDEWSVFSNELCTSVNASSSSQTRVSRTIPEPSFMVIRHAVGSQGNHDAKNRQRLPAPASEDLSENGDAGTKRSGWENFEAKHIPTFKCSPQVNGSNEESRFLHHETELDSSDMRGAREGSSLKRSSTWMDSTNVQTVTARVMQNQANISFPSLGPSHAVPARKRTRQTNGALGHKSHSRMSLPPLRMSVQAQAGGYDQADLGSKRALRNFVVNRIGGFRRSIPMFTEAGPFWHLERETCLSMQAISATDSIFSSKPRI